MSKRFAGVAIVAAAAFAPAFAQAADLPVPSEPMPAPMMAPAPAFSWTGFYVGANVGYSAADMDVSDILFEGAPPPIDLDFGLSADGVIGGGTVGYNYQFGSLVAGLEGDFDLTSLRDSFTNDVAGFTGTGELEWLSTVRGRIGFAADRFLIYGTGGLALGEIKGTIDDDYGGGVIITTDDSHTHVGWTVGGGLEYALTDHITIKGEGLYYDLGSEEYSFDEGPTGYSPITANVDASGWIARAGVNWKF